MRKIWPFTFNIFLFAGLSFVVPFLVLYYQGLGFTGAQIGLLIGIAPLVTLVSAPLWTALADATRRHRLMMSLSMLVAAGTLFAFPFFSSFAPVLLLAILLNASLAPVFSFADSATLYMLAGEKEMYSRIRLGGTFGFGLASLTAGMLIQNYGLKVAFWGGAALLLLAFGLSQKFIYGQVKAGNPATGAGPAAGYRAFLANRRWLPFLTVAFAGGLAFAITVNYLYPYLKELGANESTMGWANTVGTIAEIPVLFFGYRLLQRLKPYGLLMLAVTITGARLLLFAASSTPALILWIQLLNGLTFGAMWMAGVAYADENAPPGLSATAQGLFGAIVLGFGSAVGGFTGGLLLESLGGRGLYLLIGSIVLSIVAITLLIQRLLPVDQTPSPAV